MLYIFGGLPGTGKSTLSSALAQRINALYLRIDTIEQAICDSGYCVEGPVGYSVSYKIASENLRLGLSVIADSVNPIGITRKAWRDIAIENKVAYIEIEIICSALEEHRHRIEYRQSDISGLRLPTWQDVVERKYEQWDTEHIIVDTAGQTERQSIERLFENLSSYLQVSF